MLGPASPIWPAPPPSARVCFAQAQWERGRQRLVDLEQAAAQALTSMGPAGADRPRSLPAPKGVPLELLGTENSGRYVRLIREAYEAAREVDRERACGEDGPAGVLRASRKTPNWRLTGRRGGGGSEPGGISANGAALCVALAAPER